MKDYKHFSDFYPYYLTQHQNQTCRRLHFIGTLLVCVSFILFLISLKLYWLLLMPIFGYGFAWFGHAFYEKNKPATFTYPFYSLMADFVLFKEMLQGKHR